jgi:2-methylcitrate dehydratase PrpD
MITAMFDLVEKHKLDISQVKKLKVALSQPAFDLHGGFDTYKAKFDALLSTHYCAAVILHDKALTLAQFEPARYDDPKLRKFAAEQVEVKADRALSGVQAVVEAETTDGKTLTVRCDHPRGSAGNALTRNQIEDKFRTYATLRLSDSRIEEIIGAVTRLEELGSVRKLMDMLRAGDERRLRASAAA